jgi:serine/threonine-protein kinase
LGTPRRESSPAFSPDGRWIAYESDDSGSAAFDIYVRRFPPGGGAGRWQISSGGGRFPVWSRAGRELLYETPDGHIMAVTYTVNNNAFVADKAHVWTSEAILFSGNENNWNFDLAPDGKRLVVFPQELAQGGKANVHLTFLLNFFDELRRRLP